MHLALALCLLPATAAFVVVLDLTRRALWAWLTRPHLTAEEL